MVGSGQGRGKGRDICPLGRWCTMEPLLQGVQAGKVSGQVYEVSLGSISFLRPPFNYLPLGALLNEAKITVLE